MLMLTSMSTSVAECAFIKKLHNGKNRTESDSHRLRFVEVYLLKIATAKNLKKVTQTLYIIYFNENVVQITSFVYIY